LGDQVNPLQKAPERWGTYQRHYKLGPLAESQPYVVLYGGRHGIKSWGISRQLIVDAAARPLRTLCCRETMNSLDESVHQLLQDQISNLKLDGHFRILKNEIQGINGSIFSYAGLRHNAKGLKSYEGYDRAWVEEATDVSKNSWNILIPTIRKEGSQIFISFNPGLESDYTYQHWVMRPPPGTVVIRTSFEDNIWLTKKSRDEIEFMRATDPEEFANIYGGDCIVAIKGAVFAKEMQAVDRDGRIIKIPYTASKPVDTFWDLGDRYTSIWFAQRFPYETRLIDYYDSEGKGLNLIVKELQRKEYIYGTHWLPWDARAPQLGTGRTIEEQLQSAGFRVGVVPKVAVKTRINMLRVLFPELWFDGDNCTDGIQALRHYKWPKEGPEGQIKAKPLHDIYSHPSDALSYMAVVQKVPIRPNPQANKPQQRPVSPWV